jgi:hypothetical protein
MKLVGFRKSTRKGKKYDAIIEDKGIIKTISFGALGYQQYKDSTGLKLYSHLDHMDKARRERYRSRHRNDNLTKLSPGYFAWHYLW